MKLSTDTALGLILVVVCASACAPQAYEADASPDDAGAGADAPSPDADRLDVARPDAAPPDAARSDVARPDAARSDAAAPDSAAPDTARPDTAAPDTYSRADECAALTPVSDAELNRHNIQSCLDEVGVALLVSGSYPVSSALSIPAGAELRGLGGRPSIVLQAGNSSNVLISFGDSAAGDKARVASLKLDAHNNFGNLANAAVVTFGGSNNVLEDCEVFNATQPPPGSRVVGVYVICDQCSGNEIRDNVIYQNFLGLIFRGQSAQQVNVADGNELRDNKCDPITFVGYGEAINNHIHNNGWDCENGPIPGGGIYALANRVGGVIRGNTIHDSCGHGLDLDSVENFVIQDNNIYDPGYRFEGSAPWCSGSGAFLIDTSHSVIANNVITNNNRPSNAVDDPNQVFHATGSAAYSDLPSGGLQTIALVLAKRPSSTGYLTVGNDISDNELRSYCAPAGSCVGLGYYTSRDTGYDGSSWSAATTNYFRGNDPTGSQIGSRRCGGGWFADPDNPNVDDDQHPDPPGAWNNDGCDFY